MASTQGKAILDIQTEHREAAVCVHKPHLTYYHAGPLFTVADLHMNLLVSQEINRTSGGSYNGLLPQDLEQRGNVTAQNIRDKDIRALLSCDLALFTYDGAKLDSGTVVEFMIAKFADIPPVILRTDLRGGGDQASKDSPGQPWNLISSFWLRTTSVVVDAMLENKQALAGAQSIDPSPGDSTNRQAGDSLIKQTGK